MKTFRVFLLLYGSAGVFVVCYFRFRISRVPMTLKEWLWYFLAWPLVVGVMLCDALGPLAPVPLEGMVIMGPLEP